MKKIVVIEDDSSIRCNIVDILQSFNYEAIPASNGEDGIKIITEINPHCILCDIMMPGLNGYEVKNILSRTNNLAEIPFIFLSAKSDIADIRFGMNIGADDYISKPFSVNDLINAISSRIERLSVFRNIVPKNVSNGVQSQKIILKDKGNNKIINISDITVIQANKDYSYVHCSDGNKILSSKSLKEWESILNSDNFIRVHRSTIINSNCIKKVEKYYNRSYIAYLNNYDSAIIITQKFIIQLKKQFKVFNI